MIALGLGLLAALLWGLHDYFVRLLASRADSLALLVLVFMVGAVLMAPFALFSEGWDRFTPATMGFSLVSGLFYAGGGYGLYRAFAIGPVRLVAPICGAYPLLSVAFHMMRGGEAGPIVWLGVFTVVIGISMVTRGEAGESAERRLLAVLWSLLGAIGFAFTFGFSQWAAETAPETPVIWMARLMAVAAVCLAVILRGGPITPIFSMWRTALLLGTLDTVALMAIAHAGGFPHAEYAPVTASMFGIVTVLLAWRFLKETMRPVQWIGIMAAFSGLALLSLV
jgi:drug/metabolite transporter (DMT)-like permease